MFKIILVQLFMFSMMAGTAIAHEDHERVSDVTPPVNRVGEKSELKIPEQVAVTHWSCKEIADLGQKYASEKKLPHAVVVDGMSCSKSDLALCLLAILDKLLDKYTKEGAEAMPRNDLDRIAALHDALRDELAKYEGYLTRREEIEKMLAKPEQPSFIYKIGVSGYLRGEGTGNFRLTDFSPTPGHGEERFLYRVKPYIYWHPADYLDIHAESQGYGFSGTHQNYNGYSLYQGFIEATLPGSELLSLKGGRQEFSYGSSFIIGPDSFYDGLSFDAARLRIKPVELLTVDILAGMYATPFSGGIKGNLAGAYATYTFLEGNTVEAYTFRDTGSTVHHDGEYLNTWGGRFTGKADPVTFEFEPVYESGRVFNSLRNTTDLINAFGGHLDITTSAILAGFNHKIFLSYAYGSGSGEAASGASTAREFRTPNNDSSLFGDMSVVGDMSGVTVNRHHASGLQIYTLGWGVDVTKEANFSATGRYFNANNVEDGLSRHLGVETDFTLTYNVSERLAFIIGYDRFFTGNFFRDTSGSGKDIDYGYFMVQFDLSRSKSRLKPVKG